MPPSLLRRILFRVVLFVASALILTEAVMWIFVRLPVEPLMRLDLSNDLPGLKKEVRLERDRDGVRYLGWAPGDAPDGAARILCLGGPATMGLLQNAEDTWWGRLRTALEKNGHRVRIAAFSQDRTGIAGAASVGGTLISEMKPDVVIANFGFDDVVAQPVEYKYDPAKASSLRAPYRTPGWKQALFKVSQIARLSRLIARRSDAAVIQDRAGRPDQYKRILVEWRGKVATLQPVAGPERREPNDPIREYMDGWKALAALTSRQGCALIMTGEASLHDSVIGFSQQEVLTALMPVDYATGAEARAQRPDPAWVEKEMARFAEAAEAYAKQNNLPWLDLNGRVPRDLEHFFGDVLLTDAGAVSMAELLLPVVEPVLKARGK